MKRRQALRSIRRWRLIALACFAAVGCGGDPYASRFSLGYVGRIATDCEPRTASGAFKLDERGRVHATALGHGEVMCKNGSLYSAEVRRPVRIEIVVLSQPRESESIFVYTRIFDDVGHVLSADDGFEWSASNAAVSSGTCGGSDPSKRPGCSAASSAATIVPLAPSMTIEVRYAGVSASRTFAVVPARGGQESRPR